MDRALKGLDKLTVAAEAHTRRWSQQLLPDLLALLSSAAAILDRLPLRYPPRPSAPSPSLALFPLLPLLCSLSFPCSVPSPSLALFPLLPLLCSLSFPCSVPSPSLALFPLLPLLCSLSCPCSVPSPALALLQSCPVVACSTGRQDDQPILHISTLTQFPHVFPLPLIPLLPL
ncbi:unnamed protein product [Closterium sp. NIES-53]